MKDYQVGLGIMVIFVIFVVLVGLSNLHASGYLQGATHARLYYEATGGFPNKSWLEANEGEHFYSPKQIQETLEPYKEIK